MRLIERQLVMPGKGFPERIKRAGTDIAKHDADGADRKLDQPVLGMTMVRSRRIIRWRQFRKPNRSQRVISTESRHHVQINQLRSKPP